MKDMITIQNLTKTYGKHRGVEDVTFSVREGEIFGFLGPNGAGKSTTIRSMLGLIKYDQGEIRINGLDSVKDREKILADIGYMPSEAWFYPGMKIREILKYSAAVRKVDCTDEAEKLCDRLQVDVKRKINELSLGNRKKVSIICGLDPLMQNVFFELIQEYVNEGATCMLSTHVLSEVRNHCTRVAIMKEGKLVVTDTVDNLLSSRSKRIKMIRDGEKLDYIYKDDLNNLYKELEGHHIFITHGHAYYVSMGEAHLQEEARRRGADIVMYGHTHVPALTIDADLVTLNPGSLTYPRQQGRQATYMVMKLEKGKQPEVELKTV